MLDNENQRADRLHKALAILPMNLSAAWRELPAQEPGKWHENERRVVLYASAWCSPVIRPSAMS